MRILQVPQRLLGPTPFPLDRLLAILSVLLQEYDSDGDGPALDEDPTGPAATRVHVYATVSFHPVRTNAFAGNCAFACVQVTELADMSLLHRTGAANNLDGTAPSLRCAISHEMALALARELKVPLNDLLWDTT